MLFEVILRLFVTSIFSLADSTNPTSVAVPSWSPGKDPSPTAYLCTALSCGGQEFHSHFTLIVAIFIILI